MRLSKFESDVGSAVVEFILVLVPFVIVAAWQLSWLADSLQRTQMREVATEVARFAALADVSEAEANAYLAKRLSRLSDVDSTLVYANFVQVRLSADSHQFLDLTQHSLVVRAFARRELAR